MWLYDCQNPGENPYEKSPFVEITHIGYVDNNPTWSYPWHVHPDSYEAAFVSFGQGFFCMGDQEMLPLREGDICLIPAGLLHRFLTEENGDMEYYCLRFRGREGEDLFGFLESLGGSIISGINYLDYIKDTFHLLLDLSQSTGEASSKAFQCTCLSLLMLVRTLACNKALTIRASSDFAVGDILRYILENYSERITLQTLAERFAISQSHLSRIFMNAYHISPINYLIFSRIATSTELLLKTDLPVAEIAEKVGYDNLNHFTNLFSKRIGCTPAEYRKKNRIEKQEDSSAHRDKDSVR